METDKRRRFFLEEEIALPMEVLLMEELVGVKYALRLRGSKKARSTQYLCAPFYKNISRPLPLRAEEPDDDDRIS